MLVRIHFAMFSGLESIKDRLRREEGQALVEYALILALIAVVTIAVLNALGVNVKNILNKVSTQLSSVAG